MECGVAVVGSGVAGLMAAIAAADAPETVLFTDGPLGRSNSSMAQGGLQLPPPGADALERFGADMRRSARVPLDAARVAAFVAHVEETIACLVDWGLELDRDAQGEVVRRMAGGLSEPRIVSSRDQIGPAIMKILLNRVRAARVHVVDHARVVDVRPAARGVVLEVERAGGAVEQWRARAAVCCTGGVTFREA